MTVTIATRAITCALAVLGAAFSIQAQVVQPEGGPPQQPGQFQQLQRPEPKVVATVNEDAITEPELESTYTRRLAAMQQQGQPIDAGTAQQVRQKTLDELVESRLVEQYVIEEGPGVQQDEVQQRLGQVKQQVQAQGADFNEFLTSQGLTEKGFEKRVEGSIAWQKYQEEVITEPKLQQYFEQNKDRFPVDNFQQARPQVAQDYMTSVWQGIVKQMRPKAEIKIMEKPDDRSPSAERPFPGNVPPQQP